MRKEPNYSITLKTSVIIISVVLLTVSIFSALLSTKTNRLPKIAVINNDILVNQFSEAVAARKSLELQKHEWEKNIKTIQDTLDTIVKEMSSTYSNSSSQKKSEMESRLNHWNQEYRRYLKTVDQMSIKKEQELMTPVLNQLNSFVKTWAKRKGYDIVIGSGNGGVILSVEDQFDVTYQLISDLNAMYQSKNSNQPSIDSSDASKNVVKDSLKK